MFDRFLLTTAPTPLRRVPNPPGGIEALWIKDDGDSGVLYGGNKVRKLEFLLAEAVDNGASRVITCGAVGSNHCVATLLYATSMQFEVELLQFPQEITDHVWRNIIALASRPADLHHFGDLEAWVEAIRRRAAEAARDEQLYWIPPGGTNATGALGYVLAGQELIRQFDEQNIEHPDVVYIPAGSGGSAVGLATGIAMAGANTRVVGVRVTPESVMSEAVIKRLHRELNQALSSRGYTPPPCESIHLELRHEFYGEGYGIAGDNTRRAIQDGHELAELHLDPTYSGKAFEALLHDADEHLNGQRVVFWMTLSNRPLPTQNIENAIEVLPPAYQKYIEQVEW